MSKARPDARWLMPVKVERLRIVVMTAGREPGDPVVSGLTSAAIVAATGAPGSGSFTVTVRNAGSTVMTNAITTGTAWAAAVRANPRPSRGSSQPSARIRIPTLAANPNARGLPSIDRATPGFQAKNATPPKAAAAGTAREVRGNDANRRTRLGVVVVMLCSAVAAPDRYAHGSSARGSRSEGVRQVLFRRVGEGVERYTSELQSLAYLVCRLL